MKFQKERHTRYNRWNIDIKMYCHKDFVGVFYLLGFAIGIRLSVWWVRLYYIIGVRLLQKKYSIDLVHASSKIYIFIIIYCNTWLISHLKLKKKILSKCSKFLNYPIAICNQSQFKKKKKKDPRTSRFIKYFSPVPPGRGYLVTPRLTARVFSLSFVPFRRSTY